MIRNLTGGISAFGISPKNPINQQEAQGLFTPYGKTGKGVTSVHVGLVGLAQEVGFVIALSIFAGINDSTNKIASIIMVGVILVWTYNYYQRKKNG